MYREYQDARIQRNLKTVKILSLIALILVILSIVVYLITKWVLFEYMKTHPKEISFSYIARFWNGEDIWKRILDKSESMMKYGPNYDLWSEEISLDIIYCMGYFDIFLIAFLFSKEAATKADISQKLSKTDSEHTNKPKQSTAPKGRINQWMLKRIQDVSTESKSHNDFSNSLAYIIVSSIPVAVLVAMLFSALIAAMAGSYGYISNGIEIVSIHLGYMLPSHIFLIISSGFLIQNCVLIKREWKINPPEFIVEERQKAEEEAERKKREQDAVTCKALLEECGMQFFVEYYLQIKRLPIRDVTVSNNYLAEREVRLTAAKKIFDSGLNKYALCYIIKSYGNILPSETIDQAQSILNEIENDKGESK